MLTQVNFYLEILKRGTYTLGFQVGGGLDIHVQ